MSRPRNHNNFISQVRRVLYERGWTKGQYGNRIDGYCLVGAVDQVNLIPTRDTERFYIVLGEVAKRYDWPEVLHLTKWNDDPKTQWQDVVLLLNRMAEVWADLWDYRGGPRRGKEAAPDLRGHRKGQAEGGGVSH